MQIKSMQFGPKAPALKRVCAYARVSTSKEAMVHSLAAQVDHYSTLIRANRAWEYAGVYADEALTGTKDSRVNFQRMIADAKAGKIDMIITKSISRFARNTLTLLSTVRELKALGVDVFFEEQNIHTLSAEGELMLTLMASFAQEESRSVSENMKWRIQRNFEAGIPWDRVLLGYRFENGSYVIVPEEAETIRYIYDEYLSGAGAEMIAKRLNEQGILTRMGCRWCGKTVRGVLKNYTYTGNLLLQKTYRENHITKRKMNNNGEFPKYHVEGSHEAIIDLDTYNRVQAEIARRREKHYGPSRRKKKYPLSSKIVCGICGKNYRHRVTSTDGKWVCSTFFTEGKKACPSKQIPDSVLMYIAAEHGGPDEVERIIANPGNELIFILRDGSEHKHIWKDRSRSESWTPEMREKAREQSKCRRTSQ